VGWGWGSGWDVVLLLALGLVLLFMCRFGYEVWGSGHVLLVMFFSWYFCECCGGLRVGS